jgi:Cft2 family RNA processing exonuclease
VQLVHKHRAIFFTGDVQFDPQRLVGGAQFPEKHFDTLVMETTRGATERPAGASRAHEITRLLSTINHVLDRKGSVLIPVFALGRMQEIFLLLHEARRAGRLRAAPIYAAGLGMDLGDYMDDIARKTGLANYSRNIPKELGVKRPPRNLQAGREPKEKGIYVVSSGMMVENTPSYLLASCLIGQPHNAVCFVGYCDPETPGGRLLATRQGETFVFETLNFQTALRATIERFEMTGHADRDELLAFALRAEPRAIVLTHGDPPARAWFKEQLAELAPRSTVLDPEPLRTYVV